MNAAISTLPSATATREGSAVKVRNSIRSVKKQPGSQVVRRRGRVYVINKRNPRLKTRQG